MINERRIAHPVAAAELPDDQLRIHPQLHAVGTETDCRFHGRDCGAILRLVVRASTDGTRNLRQPATLLVDHESADRRWPGVAARSAVAIGDQSLAAARRGRCRMW